MLLLATSPAFWDRSSQVIPQAVDLAIFPLAAYLFLSRRNVPFIASAAYMFYNHSMYAALPLFSLFLYSLVYEREKIGVFFKILIVTLPLILVIGANLEGVISESRSINEQQEGAVLEEPLFAIKYLGYPLFFLIFLSLIHLGFNKPEGFESLLLLWVLSLIPMTIYFPDRFIQYLAQPLAIIGAITLSDLIPNKRLRQGVFFLLSVFGLAVQYNLFTTVVRSGGVLMPLNTLSPFVK